MLVLCYYGMAKYHPPAESNFRIQRIMDPLLGTAHSDTHQQCTLSEKVERVHLVVLVHGFIGCPQDLAYVRLALEKKAAEALHLGRHNERFVVHNCEANHGKTWDGIQAGADRIAKEIQQVLQSIRDEFSDVREVSFSILGYSLGGMYARAALPHIFVLDEGASCNLLKLTPKVFCTLATPHLGSRGHTYFEISGLFENWVGKVSKTSKDLFRENSVLDDLINDLKFVQPMLRFKKRIAYTNTNGMDVMVPTSTAAFLSETSQSIHYNVGPKHHACMSRVVTTPHRHEVFSEPRYAEMAMSEKLDAMGWTKVFADFLHCPNLSPSLATSRSSYTSSELLTEFGFRKKSFFLPMGHDLLAVNSKNALYAYIMQRGKPLVDQLADDIIQDILG